MRSLHDIQIAGKPAFGTEKSWGTSTVQECRQRLHDIGMLDFEINNRRLRREALRFLCVIAASNYKLWQNLRYDDLRRLKGPPDNVTSAWLGSAYREAPRSLSMDATAWTRWDSPVTPWTTWRASWITTTTRSTSSPQTTRVVRHRWVDRMLGRFDRKAGIPAFVSAFRRSQPSRRPRSPKTRKTPAPLAGGFIEHLDENRRFQGMLSFQVQRSAECRNASKGAHRTETGINRSSQRSKSNAGVSVNDDDCEKHRSADKRREKRRNVYSMVKGMF